MHWMAEEDLEQARDKDVAWAAVGVLAAVLLPANVLHVLAMAAWLGGVAVLVLALRAATARLEPLERTRLLAAVVGRFSAVAGVAVAALLVSGVAQGIVEVRTLGNLVDTAFGRAVAIKVVLFAELIALGAVNRRRLLPALARAARERSTPAAPGSSCGARCAASSPWASPSWP